MKPSLTNAFRGAGLCEVCGKTLERIGLSRCSAHAMAKPVAWKLVHRKPINNATDIDEGQADVEAQRA